MTLLQTQSNNSFRYKQKNQSLNFGHLHYHSVSVLWKGSWTVVRRKNRKIKSSIAMEVDLSLSARLSIHTYDWNPKFGSFYLPEMWNSCAKNRTTHITHIYGRGVVKQENEGKTMNYCLVGKMNSFIGWSASGLEF